MKAKKERTHGIFREDQHFMWNCPCGYRSSDKLKTHESATKQFNGHKSICIRWRYDHKAKKYREVGV